MGHSLKNVGPSQKTLRHPWCPKLVTGLIIAAAQHVHDERSQGSNLIYMCGHKLR